MQSLRIITLHPLRGELGSKTLERTTSQNLGRATLRIPRENCLGVPSRKSRCKAIGRTRFNKTLRRSGFRILWGDSVSTLWGEMFPNPFGGAVVATATVAATNAVASAAVAAAAVATVAVDVVASRQIARGHVQGCVLVSMSRRIRLSPPGIPGRPREADQYSKSSIFERGASDRRRLGAAEARLAAVRSLAGVRNCPGSALASRGEEGGGGRARREEAPVSAVQWLGRGVAGLMHCDLKKC